MTDRLIESAERMAVEAGVDPHDFRVALREAGVPADHRPYARYSYRVGSHEHRQMLEILNKVKLEAEAK